MIICYGTDEFPGEYVPTVFDVHSTSISFDQKEIDLKIWDTGGQAEFEASRHLAYKDTNCFIVCFALNDRQSYQNALKVWPYELKQRGYDNTARILVGLKSDLRDEMAQNKSDPKSYVTT